MNAVTCQTSEFAKSDNPVVVRSIRSSPFLLEIKADPGALRIVRGEDWITQCWGEMQVLFYLASKYWYEGAK